MMTLRKFFKKLAWLLLLITLLTTSLLADGKKTLPPTPPESQKECDQIEPKATPSTSSISSPMGPANEKTVPPDILTPPSLNNQESTESGG